MDQNFRDLVTSHLKEDTRIHASVLAMRRVFEHPMYSVYICVYSGLVDSISLADDLVTCLVVFKEERLRIMFKMWTMRIEGDPIHYIQEVLKILQSQGKNPMHLIQDAKTWGHVDFTIKDRAAFRMADIHLPKPPKEHWT